MVRRHVSSLFPCALFLFTGLAFAQSPTIPQPPATTPPGPTEQLVCAPLNPDFVVWRQRAAAGPVKALNAAAPSGGHVPSPVDRSHLRDAKIASVHAPLPSSYSLRPQYVTSVRDQGQCGACWAFATYGSLESWLLKNKGERLDFSENHLKNRAGFDWAPCEGGNQDMSIAYLARWDGPVAESDDPYDGSDDGSSPSRQVRKYVLGALWFVRADDIKNAIMTYGALYSGMYWDWDCYDRDANTHCYSGDESDNHDVAIVGWDNQKSVPGSTAKGAWLVRHSWGTDVGDAGYTYVSYEDTKMAREAVAFCDAVPTATYATNYYYDKLGQVTSTGFEGRDYGWGANVFTARADENLTAVGFYAVAEDTAYRIDVYDTVTPAGVDVVRFSDRLAPTTSGTAQRSGYHTITLSSAIPLEEGNEVAIVVKFTTPDYESPLAIELPVEGYSSQASASPGESYVSSTGVSFTDITSMPGLEETNICIRGLTAKPAGDQARRVLWDVRHGPCGDDWLPYVGYKDLIALLEAKGFEFATTSDPGGSFDDLSSWSVLVVSVGTAWNTPYGSGEVASIRTFVESGGGLLILGDHPRCANYVRPIAMDYGFITGLNEGWEGEVYVSTFSQHPIFENCSCLCFRVAGSLAFSGGKIVAWNDSHYGMVGVASAGEGRVVVTGDCDFCHDRYIRGCSNKVFIENVFEWLAKMR